METKKVEYKEYLWMLENLVCKEGTPKEKAQRIILDHYLEENDGYVYFKNKAEKTSLFVNRVGMSKKAKENQFNRFKTFMSETKIEGSY